MAGPRRAGYRRVRDSPGQGAASKPPRSRHRPPGGPGLRRAHRRAALRPRRHGGGRSHRHARAGRAGRGVDACCSRSTPSASSSPTAPPRRLPGNLGAGGSPQPLRPGALQSLWLALALSVVAMGVGAVAAEPLLRGLGAEGEVLTNGLVYLRISLLGLPALFVDPRRHRVAARDPGHPHAAGRGPAARRWATSCSRCVLVFGFDQGIGASALSTVVVAVARRSAVYFRSVLRGGRARPARRRARTSRASAGWLRVGRDLLVRTAALRAALTRHDRGRCPHRRRRPRGAPDRVRALVVPGAWRSTPSPSPARRLIGTHLGARPTRTRRRAAGDRMLDLGLVLGAAAGLAVIGGRGRRSRTSSPTTLP